MIKRLICAIFGHRPASFEIRSPIPGDPLVCHGTNSALQITMPTKELGEVTIESKVCSRCMSACWVVTDSKYHRIQKQVWIKKELEKIQGQTKLALEKSPKKFQIFRVAARRMPEDDLITLRYLLYLEQKRRCLIDERQDQGTESQS